MAIHYRISKWNFFKTPKLYVGVHAYSIWVCIYVCLYLLLRKDSEANYGMYVDIREKLVELISLLL